MSVTIRLLVPLALAALLLSGTASALTVEDPDSWNIEGSRLLSPESSVDGDWASKTYTDNSDWGSASPCTETQYVYENYGIPSLAESADISAKTNYGTFDCHIPGSALEGRSTLELRTGLTARNMNSGCMTYCIAVIANVTLNCPVEYWNGAGWEKAEGSITFEGSACTNDVNNYYEGSVEWTLAESADGGEDPPELPEGDTEPPNITITSPAEGGFYNQTLVSLNWTASEGLDTAWYSLNGGSNVTLSGNVKIGAPEGENTLRVYGKDASGNIGMSEVSFTVGQFCSDGTAYGECSGTLPMYCNGGVLVENCTFCGCPEGENCSANQTCYVPEPPQDEPEVNQTFSPPADEPEDEDPPSGGGPACQEDWSCGIWEDCMNGTQKRNCTDLNSCGTTVLMPDIYRNCEIESSEPNETAGEDLEPDPTGFTEPEQDETAEDIVQEPEDIPEPEQNETTQDGLEVTGMVTAPPAANLSEVPIMAAVMILVSGLFYYLNTRQIEG